LIGQDAQSKATDLPDGASVFLATSEVTRGIGLNSLAISVFCAHEISLLAGGPLSLPGKI
jgi:hypothetical protein